jgi:TatD DNase family protein
VLVDTHCHLNFHTFDDDRISVIQRARDWGIERILIPGIDLVTSKEAVYYATKYEEVYAAVGIHPNESLAWDESTLRELYVLSQNPKVVAIGEIGIDYFRDRVPRETQEVVFRNQLMLAAERKLPVIIHTRNSTNDKNDAIDDVLNILKDWVHSNDFISRNNESFPGVLHSFSGNVCSTHSFLELNFFLGITGPVTFRKADILQEVVKSVSLNHILIETDAPFLSPHPYRGERNEPRNVRIIAEKIAELKNCDLERVVEITAKNSINLFHW